LPQCGHSDPSKVYSKIWEQSFRQSCRSFVAVSKVSCWPQSS
jgi:hypothetical protein